MISVTSPQVPILIRPEHAEEHQQRWLSQTEAIACTVHLGQGQSQGKPTLSAHPARFSPEDKYSQQRITIKQRFGLLPTQQPAPKY